MNHEAHRTFLWNLGYRITGSTADAEEVAQETLLRCLETHPREDLPLRPWLARVASRLSVDRLRERQARPSAGPWLPALVETTEQALEPEPASDVRYDLRESATFAFLVALEVLSPEQRAALVLRDVFEFSAREAGDALELSEDHVRQLHRRARQALEGYDAERCRPDARTRRRSRELLEGLLAALANGDARAAAKLLRTDVKAVNDGGGRYSAAKVPLVGIERVFLFYRRLAELRTPASMEFKLCNGLWVLETRFEDAAPNEAPVAVTGLVPSESGIGLIFTQLAPAKLPDSAAARAAPRLW